MLHLLITKLIDCNFSTITLEFTKLNLQANHFKETHQEVVSEILKSAMNVNETSVCQYMCGGLLSRLPLLGSGVIVGYFFK